MKMKLWSLGQPTLVITDPVHIPRIGERVFIKKYPAEIVDRVIHDYENNEIEVILRSE